MYGLACYIWTRSDGQSATTSNHSATPKHVRHQTPPKKTSASHSEMRQKKNPKPCILSSRHNFHSSLILLLSAEMEQASSRGVSRLWFASCSSLIALQKAPKSSSHTLGPAHFSRIFHSEAVLIRSPSNYRPGPSLMAKPVASI